MRFPIKFKQESLPRSLRRIVPSIPHSAQLLREDLQGQAFTDAISAICIDGVWRTTCKGRHSGSDKLLLARIGERKELRILDVGISDGVTSLELAEKLNAQFSVFYGTDLHVSLKLVETEDGLVLYRPPEMACVMVVTRRLVVYNPPVRGINPLNRLAARICDKAPSVHKSRSLSLLHPRLRSRAEVDSRIQLMEWDIFRPWPREQIDVVRVANLLNPCYFSSEDLLRGVSNLFTATKEDGLIQVVETRSAEQSTLFRKFGNRLEVVSRLGPGCDVERLCLDHVLKSGAAR
jgi:hypothetical protein